MNPVSSTQKQGDSRFEEHLSMLREVLRTTSDRTRSVVYILTILNFIVFALIPLERNNWHEAKYAKLRAIDIYMSQRFGGGWGTENDIGPSPEVRPKSMIEATLDYVRESVAHVVSDKKWKRTEVKYEIEAKPEILRLYGYIDATRKSDRSVLRRLVQSQQADTESRRGNAQSFGLPLLPIEFSLADYGRITGAIFLIVIMLIYFCLRREYQTLRVFRAQIAEYEHSSFWATVAKCDQVLGLWPVTTILVATLILYGYLLRTVHQNWPDQRYFSTQLADQEYYCTAAFGIAIFVAVCLCMFPLIKNHRQWRQLKVDERWLLVDKAKKKRGGP